MQKLAIIGASYLQLPLVKKAKEMGLHTICFAWAEGAVCKDEADEFFPISIVEKEQILEVCREKQIDGICTIASDVAAPTVTYVAEKMRLVGNTYEVALNCSFKHEAIVEEYVEGREISVEFISYQGKHFPLQITDKVTTGAPHFVELEHHQPSDLSEEQYAQIYDLTKKALDALGVTNGASHSEYKITTDGRIYVMEIGARMGGDFIGSDLVQLSTGYDYLKGVIDVALGNFGEPVFGEHHFAGVYFLCEETKHLQTIIKEAKLPQIFRAEITDEVLRPVKCSADRSGYLIYQVDKRLVL